MTLLLYPKTPLTISGDDTLIDSINLMNDRQIWDLPVLNKNNDLIGLPTYIHQ